VSEELDWDPSIDAAAIGVEVNDGIVTLKSTNLKPGADSLSRARANQTRTPRTMTRHDSP